MAGDRILNRLDLEQGMRQISVNVKNVGAAAGAVGREATKEGFFFYLILAVAVHLIDWGAGFPRSKSFFDLSDKALYTQLLMAFVVWLVFFFKSEDLQNSLRKFVPLLLVAYFAYIFPIIGLTHPELRYSLGSNVLTNPIMHPIWLYFGLFMFKENRFARWMLNIIVLFWFTYLFLGLFSGAKDLGYSGLSPEHYATMSEVVKQYASGVKTAVSVAQESVSKATSSWFKANVALATGTYYSGEAEEAKPVGVIIEKMEGFPTQFPIDKAVVVNAWIKAMDGVTEPIKVKSTACWSEQTTQNVQLVGESSPQTMTVFPGSEQSLRCNMAKKLGSGSYNIYFAANYELSSRATLDTFFADFGKKYEADKAGIDLLEDFPNKRTVSTYTNGPIMVGVGVTGKAPIGIVNKNSDFCMANEANMDICASHGDMPLMLGITLENRDRWEGEATALNSIQIDLPKGLFLNLKAEDSGGTCDFSGEQVNAGERNVYELSLKPELGGPITDTIAINTNKMYELSGREYTIKLIKTEKGHDLLFSGKGFNETIKDIELNRIYRKRGVDIEIKNIDDAGFTFSIGVPLSAENYNAFQCDLIYLHDTLLGGDPVAPKSVVVNINYNFMTKKPIGIKVTQ